MLTSLVFGLSLGAILLVLGRLFPRLAEWPRMGLAFLILTLATLGLGSIARP